MLTFILFILGFYILVKGADALVEGSSSIAKRFNVSDIVIGLTIVAFGTSMPELFVNIFSSIKGNTDIAIGNILGSNIVNILLILGVSAIVYPISVKKNTIWKEIPFGLLAAVVVGILANDVFFGNGTTNFLSRGDGLILISFFVIFMYYMFGIAKTDSEDMDGQDVVIHKTSKSILMIVLGLAGLMLGGKWIVDAAVQIATFFGLSQALIGLSIVAVGTSLPEFATSVVAARKGKSDIAIGNVAGSNIFNIFWILGISSIISPLPFSNALNFDVWMTVLASFVLFAVMFVGKKAKIGKMEGVLFIAMYVMYLGYIMMRG